jgi:hypothetical protein
VGALALLGLLLALLGMGVIRPLFDYVQSRADERSADLRALSRDRALVAQAPRIRDALASAEHSARWSRFYDSQRPDQALVQLQGDLRELLKAPNNPTSMTAQVPRSRGTLTRLAVKVTLSMSLDQWTEALARLQTHAKLLQINALVIQAPDYQSADSNPTLAIQAEIVGFMITPASART